MVFNKRCYSINQWMKFSFEIRARATRPVSVGGGDDFDSNWRLRETASKLRLCVLQQRQLVYTKKIINALTW